MSHLDIDHKNANPIACSFETDYSSNETKTRERFRCDQLPLGNNKLCLFHDENYIKNQNHPENKDIISRRIKRKLEKGIIDNTSIYCIGYNIPEVNIKSKEFKQSLYFVESKFAGVVDFSGATFSNNALANFSGATFSNNALADFSGATFSNNARANFSGAKFFGEATANFSNAIFSNYALAIFIAANFLDNARANFSGATFSNNARANFSGAKFFGEATANFNSATFSNNALAIFIGAYFLDKATANFNRATFSGPVDFSYATFSGPVYFAYAKFLGEAAASFKETKFPKGYITYFQSVTFDKPNDTIFDVKDMSHVSFLDTDITRVRFSDRTAWGGDTVDKFKVIEEQWLEEDIEKPLKHRRVTLVGVLSVYRNLRENYEFRRR